MNMTTSDKPFRVKPRPASPRAQKAWNKVFPEQADASIDELQNRIKADRGRAEDLTDKLLAWGQHPDERVQITLIEQAEDLRKNAPDHRDQLDNSLRKLYREACQRAQQEGKCWTPVLDRLAARGETPNSQQRKSLPDEFSRAAAREKLHPLKAWIQQQDDPRLLGVLFNFRALEPLQYVANFAPTIDDRLREVLLHRDHSLAASLALNQNLPAKQQTKLREWALEQFRSYQDRKLLGLAPARDTLLNLEDRGAIEAKQLTQLLCDALREESGKFHQVGPQAQYATEVISRLDISETSLITTAKHFSTNSSVIRKLLQHPQAGVEYYRWAVRTGSLGVRMALAQHPEACRDPEVREILQQDREDATILCHLTRTARGEEFDKLFSQLVEVSPQAAISIIEEGAKAEGPPIESRHLTLLLGQAQGRIRRQALRAAQQFRQAPSPEPGSKGEEPSSIQKGR